MGYHSRSPSNADLPNLSSHGTSSRMNSMRLRPTSLSLASQHDSHPPPSPRRTPSPSPLGRVSRTSSDADASVRGYSPSVVENNLVHEEQTLDLLIQAMNSTKNEHLKRVLLEIVDAMQVASPGGNAIEYRKQSIVAKEGFLWKKGKALHLWSKRYYLISGNCVYYYANKSDIRPKGVIFLTGSLVEKVRDRDLALKGYYGFELLHQDLISGEHHRQVQLIAIIIFRFFKIDVIGMSKECFIVRVKRREMNGWFNFNMLPQWCLLKTTTSSARNWVG